MNVNAMLKYVTQFIKAMRIKHNGFYILAILSKTVTITLKKINTNTVDALFNVQLYAAVSLSSLLVVCRVILLS